MKFILPINSPIRISIKHGKGTESEAAIQKDVEDENNWHPMSTL